MSAGCMGRRDGPDDRRLQWRLHDRLLLWQRVNVAHAVHAGDVPARQLLCSWQRRCAAVRAWVLRVDVWQHRAHLHGHVFRRVRLSRGFHTEYGPWLSQLLRVRKLLPAGVRGAHAVPSRHVRLIADELCADVQRYVQCGLLLRSRQHLAGAVLCCNVRSWAFLRRCERAAGASLSGGVFRSLYWSHERRVLWPLQCRILLRRWRDHRDAVHAGNLPSRQLLRARVRNCGALCRGLVRRDVRADDRWL